LDDLRTSLDESAAAPPGTDVLFATVYDELKRLARQRLRAVDAAATLSTTDLVHEAFLKLARGPDASSWGGRAHFFGSASRAMRQVLVDFARRRHAAKRGGPAPDLTLDESEHPVQIEIDQVLALDAALDRLEAVDPRLRQIVELRFFGGLPERDIADLLGVSTRTVERAWLKARLFLVETMGPTPSPHGTRQDPEDTAP
jgi:RNA polymerase sigma factor (TIGR02999 family)